MHEGKASSGPCGRSSGRKRSQSALIAWNGGRARPANAENLLAGSSSVAASLKSDPQGAGKLAPPDTPTNQVLYPEQDTVMAFEGVQKVGSGRVTEPKQKRPEKRPQEHHRGREEQGGGGAGGNRVRVGRASDRQRHRDAAFDRRADAAGTTAARTYL